MHLNSFTLTFVGLYGDGIVWNSEIFSHHECKEINHFFLTEPSSNSIVKHMDATENESYKL